MKSGQQIVRVALNVPVNDLFDYLSNDTSIQRGQYVKVPFGNRHLVGIVFEISNSTNIDSKKLKYIASVEPEIIFDAGMLKLLAFVAEYYHHPIGQTIMSVVPSRIKKGKGHSINHELVFNATSKLTQDIIDQFPKRQIRLKRLAKALLEAPIRQKNLSSLVSNGMQLIYDLEQADLCQRSEWQDTPQPSHHFNKPKLNDAQSKAIKSILDKTGFLTWLLHGVTGSGKTEVYLNLIEKVIANHQQVLVLVPEINLTPQLEARFLARFSHEKIVILHSYLTELERLRHWQEARQGQAKIIIGTRLAVFTPIKSLGMIIIDEEHDASFKQQDGLKYHARDVALVRAQHLKIPVVLGSATPSLESWRHATQEQNKYQYLSLPKRAVDKAVMPTIKLIPSNSSKSEGLSQPLIEAIEHNLAQGQQTLIYINRRGYAPVLVCSNCGWYPSCQRCSAKLVFHQASKQLKCHHCDHSQKIIDQCSQCGNDDLIPLGKGTQKIEEWIQKQFPKSRMLRVDRDTIRSKKAIHELYTQASAGEIDILVGTQMLSKGHDFPRLSLVIILDIDGALYSTHFRATERTFAQLTQVAGRAGRADTPGQVMIQTDFPGHPIFQFLKQNDFKGFADSLLLERQQMQLVPYSHLALLNVEAKQMHQVNIFLDDLMASINEHPFKGDVFGPVQPQLKRLKGYERMQLFFHASTRKDLHQCLEFCLNRIRNSLYVNRVKWSLDVDPIDF